MTTTSLAAEIDALRVAMRDTHDEALRLLDALDARMFADDAEVMRRLEAIKAGDAARKVDIVRALQQVAGRLGLLPSLTPSPFHPLPVAAQVHGGVPPLSALPPAASARNGAH